MRSSGNRQQSNPARFTANAVDYSIIGDGALALLRIGTDPFAVTPRELGERQIDASLPQFRQPDHDSPVNFSRCLFTKGAGQKRCSSDCAGEDEDTTGFLV